MGHALNDDAMFASDALFDKESGFLVRSVVIKHPLFTQPTTSSTSKPQYLGLPSHGLLVS